MCNCIRDHKKRLVEHVVNNAKNKQENINPDSINVAVDTRALMKVAIPGYKSFSVKITPSFCMFCGKRI